MCACVIRSHEDKSRRKHAGTTRRAHNIIHQSYIEFAHECQLWSVLYRLDSYSTTAVTLGTVATLLSRRRSCRSALCSVLNTSDYRLQHTKIFEVHAAHHHILVQLYTVNTLYKRSAYCTQESSTAGTVVQLCTTAVSYGCTVRAIVASGVLTRNVTQIDQYGRASSPVAGRLASAGLSDWSVPLLVRSGLLARDWLRDLFDLYVQQAFQPAAGWSSDSCDLCLRQVAG